MRVISLLPSATEIVDAIGGMDRVVGITHCCDEQPLAPSRVRVTRTAVDATAAPGVIDAFVKELSSLGEPLYTLDEERITALRPDLIITQALCEVCAVRESDVQALATRLTPTPRIVTLAATSMDAVLDDIRTVGAAMGLDAQAQTFIENARARMLAVHETLKAAKAPRPRVAVIEWGDPLYAAGHWVPEMIKRAGGIDVLAKAGEHSVVVSLEQVRAADPDIIIYAPCGYALEQSVVEARKLLGDSSWNWARGKRIYALDANAYVSRPGPRLVDGVEGFARLFNPHLFTPLASGFARELAL